MRRLTARVMVRGGAATVAALLLGASVQGCDVCAGVANCVATDYLAVNGQIVEAASGAGVDGVRIDVIRTDGLLVTPDSQTVTTSGGGLWRAALDAPATGEVIVRIRVSPPGGASYEVAGVRLLTTERGGDANVLPRWVSAPYFRHFGELLFRSSADTRIADVSTEFRRTGGVTLLVGGAERDRIGSRTDAAGRVSLFAPTDGVSAGGLGEVIGDLHLALPSPYSEAVVRGIRIPSTHLYRDPPRIYRASAGPSLNYVGEFQGRARRSRLAGVRVDFRRTGGVPLSADRFSTISGGDGRWSFESRPLASGVVEGELVFTAPDPSTPETLQVKLPTFDEDAGRFVTFGVLLAGAYLPYYGTAKIGGVGRPGIKVDVHRSGGSQIAPADTTVETDGDGIFKLQFVPLGLGDVFVDLTFRPPPPHRSFSVLDVRLTPATRDVPDRQVWVWGMDTAPDGPPGTRIVLR